MGLSTEYFAALAPDSRSLLYDAPPRPDEKRDLYVSDLEGNKLYRLTYHPGSDVCADWWAPSAGDREQ